MYWVMAILPFVLLLLGFPIFLLLLATSLVILLFFFDLPMAVVHQDIFNSLNKYALLAVPFFVFAGDLMSRGGISNRLLRWVASMIGGFRAHIPMTSLGFAALFGAISGVTTAATAAIGTLTYPRMREAGYSERFASALITAEGALDNLIPPSIAMIIYGIASDTSVIQLFAAGIGPGLLLAGMFGVYIIIIRGASESWRAEILVQGILLATRDGVSGHRRHRHHIRRHLFGRVLADGSRRRRLHLRDHRQLFRLSRNDVA
jgi:C4-dicarboxylate transporter DctM subunit